MNLKSLSEASGAREMFYLHSRAEALAAAVTPVDVRRASPFGADARKGGVIWCVPAYKNLFVIAPQAHLLDVRRERVVDRHLAEILAVVRAVRRQHKVSDGALAARIC